MARRLWTIQNISTLKPSRVMCYFWRSWSSYGLMSLVEDDEEVFTSDVVMMIVQGCRFERWLLPSCRRDMVRTVGSSTPSSRHDVPKSRIR